MTTAWSWSLMREPQLRSTTLAATPQVKREEGGSTEWGGAGSCSVSPAEGWMQSPKSLCGDSCNQQLLGFSIGMGKMDGMRHVLEQGRLTFYMYRHQNRDFFTSDQ